MGEWIINEKESFLQSKLFLDKGFKHAFFTKKAKADSPSRLINLLSHKHEIYMLKQIHSNIVLESSNLHNNQLKEADGLISDNSKHQSLWLYTADCIPILFADIKTGQVAACHAGWKGIAKNIIANLINRLKSKGTRVSDLIVSLGPAISYLNYQVNAATVSQIYTGINKEKEKKNENYMQKLKNLNVVKINEVNNEILLDIRMAATIQLKSEGLAQNQLSINNNCTFKDESLFYSWRRDKVKDYQWSVILTR